MFIAFKWFSCNKVKMKHYVKYTRSQLYIWSVHSPIHWPDKTMYPWVFYVLDRWKKHWNLTFARDSGILIDGTLMLTLSKLYSLAAKGHWQLKPCSFNSGGQVIFFSNSHGCSYVLKQKKTRIYVDNAQHISSKWQKTWWYKWASV